MRTSSSYLASHPSPVDRRSLPDRVAITRSATIAALALMSGCVAAPRTPPPPIAVATPVPAPRPAPLAVDWRDWPYSPGTWRYRRDPRGSIAAFGQATGGAALTLRCDLVARQVHLTLASGMSGALTIHTSSATRALAMQPVGGTPGVVDIVLAPNDPLLEAMGFSRGRFVVEQAGATPLVVPAWAEIERVTEDCRG